MDTIQCPAVLPEDIKDVDLEEIKQHVGDNLIKLNEATIDLQKKIANQRPTPCNIQDVTWLEKKINSMLYFLNEDINKEEGDVSRSESELYIELFNTLVQANKEQQDLINYLSEELQQNKEIFKETKQFTHFTQSDIEVDFFDNYFIPILNLPEIERKIKQCFRDSKADLHRVLETCFDDNTRTLLQDLTAKYFEDDDKYIDVTDEIYFPSVALLKKSCLITTHPYDKKKIRLYDLTE